MSTGTLNPKALDVLREQRQLRFETVKHEDFGKLRLAFETEPEYQEVKLTLANVACNLAAAVASRELQGLREESQLSSIDSITFVRPLSGGVMGQTWLIHLRQRSNPEKRISLVLKTVINGEEELGARFGLASEVVASQILGSDPELSRLPRCIEYALSVDDAPIFNELLPKNKVALSIPTKYIEGAAPASYGLQLFVEGMTLAECHDENVLVPAMISHARLYDRLASKGILHTDSKHTNVIILEGTSKTALIDWGGFQHAQAQPRIAHHRQSAQNEYPRAYENSETVYLWARRDFMLDTFGELTGGKGISTAAALGIVSQQAIPPERYTELFNDGLITADDYENLKNEQLTFRELRDQGIISSERYQSICDNQVIQFDVFCKKMARRATAIAARLADTTRPAPTKEELEPSEEYQEMLNLLATGLFYHLNQAEFIPDREQAIEFINYLLDQYQSPYANPPHPSCTEVVADLLILYNPTLENLVNKAPKYD